MGPSSRPVGLFGPSGLRHWSGNHLVQKKGVVQELAGLHQSAASPHSVVQPAELGKALWDAGWV